MASAKGLMAKGVPPQAAWLLYIKIAILVLNLIVLALAAYAISLFGYYYSTGSAGYLIFVTVKTFLILGGALVVEIWFPHLFYRLIALVCYILSIIFWLSAWAWAASVASIWLGWGASDYATREGGALAGCAGLGAIIWVLSIVNLVFFIRACLADPEGSYTNLNRPVEFAQVKQEPTVTTQPVDQYEPEQTPYVGQYQPQPEQTSYAGHQYPQQQHNYQQV